MWQATYVQNNLLSLGLQSVLVPLKSEGDQDVIKPLYEMGVVGVFTKVLDTALLNNTIDLAVHSMKDVPTLLPEGIVQAAVLERGDSSDILVTKKNTIDYTKPLTIATSSLRRKAQWLHKYPQHRIEVLRGNVQTRLKKLESNNWDGAIFAKAGLDRLQISPKYSSSLDWMVPAPAQGAIMIATHEENLTLQKQLATLNHIETAFCVQVERDFLRALEGGCSAPIGARAFYHEKEICFMGNISSPDGSQSITLEKTSFSDSSDLGQVYAQEILSKGGKQLLEKIKSA
jgi:hydroxymethylbilane synthase